MRKILFVFLFFGFSVCVANTKPIDQRIDFYSASFLGKPYILDALGEGPQGEFSKNPLYRTDGFDCYTYVSTVLALANSAKTSDIQKNLDKINYRNANVAFVNRNHFVSVDWNPNNARNGFIRDITNTIVDKHKRPIAEVARALIDKPAWYQHLTADRLHLPGQTPAQQAASLAKLHALAAQVKAEMSEMPYLPLSKIFDATGRMDPAIMAQIPNGAVIEIVRPNWQLKDKIGTNMNVSHLGFAIRTPQGLMYRNASSQVHKVFDVPLAEYLWQYRNSPTIKGINVQQVRG